MIRLFLPPKNLSSQQVVISGDQARYLSSVVRLKPGELLTIFDGRGRRYVCKSLKIQKKEVIVEKVEEELFSAESPLSLILAQGIPKGDKMDLIIQKSTELGVEKIVPLITERSQIRHTERRERWHKIALSASQQSGREKVPIILKPVNLHEFLERHHTGHGIMLSEEVEERNFRKTLNDLQGVAGITLLVGPEGGFSKNEVTAAIEKGFKSVSLGPRILRTETAPITALSIIQYELGDVG
ncbi:MAG: 16S rRNA (uracil(1498)-N(3))-methyltransferase [Nitrospiraceae bacterium]|nr:MAG: 16S rRNA (uracil(1498)-N(3))-methyltransferase [Nitrospiraceae bacterium]